MSQKGIFEDSDESESGEDFSASEDEWQPGKDDHVSDEDEDDIPSANSSDIESGDEGGSQSKKKLKKS